MSDKQPGLVHCAKAPAKHGAWITYCQLTSGPRTFVDGLSIHGCKKCIDAGAPYTAAAA